MRRGLALLTLGLAVLAGCSTDAPKTTEPTKPTASADPVAVVRNSMTNSLASTVHIDGKVSAFSEREGLFIGPLTITFSADTDPAARVIKLSITTPKPGEVLAVGDNIYIKQENSAGKPWLLIDIRKLKATSQLRQSLDIESQTGILGGVLSAENVAPGRYEGVADLHKAAAAAPESARGSLESAAKIAKNASAVAYKATVDVEGRLTSLTYTLQTPTRPAVSEMTLGRFGEPVTVSPPPDDQVATAPESIYDLL